jgi:hypothetical protein
VRWATKEAGEIEDRHAIDVCLNCGDLRYHREGEPPS